MNAAPPPPGTFSWRLELHDGDVQAIEALVRATGFFTDEEAGVAGQLAADRLEKGTGSDYEFLIAERADRMIGYTCYGRTPCTPANYDLYWIAVAPDHQGRHIGAGLFARTEFLIGRKKGRRIYAETSGTDKYAPTRRFYEASGFRREAVLADFYRDGDDKVIYMKPVKELNP